MAKRFKLRFSLSNFQLCRSSTKNPPTSFFSPVNPKTLDVSFPNGPEPPPTTPMPLTPKSLRTDDTEGNTRGPRTDAEKNKAAVKMLKTLKSFSSFNSELDFDSYEFDESYSFDEGATTMMKGPLVDEEKNKAAMKMLNTLKSFSSFRSDFTLDDDNEKQTIDDTSAAVVKVTSEEPYEDFKRSMVEMILQKKMFEVNDLERLLQWFLSLNSVEHHTTIVEAFTEIWEVLFCED